MIRRDGQQPIIFMRRGPIRHTAAKSESAPQEAMYGGHIESCGSGQPHREVLVDEVSAIRPIPTQNARAGRMRQGRGKVEALWRRHS
jgi:hypothetical protein